MSKPTQNRQLITRLQTTIHEVLAPLVPASGSFALLDFPTYPNVGDSAIWLGEIEYFRKDHNILPAYVRSCRDYPWEELESALPENPLFLQGGGDFGDLWPAHKHFRERVIEHFRHRTIVQLPQSLYFSNPAALQRASGIVNAHPDFTLLVRDRKSLAITQESFTCRVELCPDMAFCLGTLNRPMRPSHQLLLLMRTDKERVETAEAPTLPPHTITADWLIDDPGMLKKVRRRTSIQCIPRLGIHALNKQRQRELHYRLLAETRLERGLRLLSSASFVITDRLHAHILCTLLDLPHIALDDSYGKLSSFIEAWTNDGDRMRSRSNLAEALKLIEQDHTHDVSFYTY